MTRVAPIRYYQGRVAYPGQEQMRRAKQMLDFDSGDDNRPTEDRDCTHLQRIEIRGPAAQISGPGGVPGVGRVPGLEEEALKRFFDAVGYKRGFRVLTHDRETDSHHGEVVVVHEIVYVIESRPTKGYVKLTLKAEVPKPDTRTPGQQEEDAFTLFSGDAYGHRSPS